MATGETGERRLTSDAVDVGLIVNCQRHLTGRTFCCSDENAVQNSYSSPGSLIFCQRKALWPSTGPTAAGEPTAS